MPITQDYNINTGNAYEGMVYGLRTAMDIRTVEDARLTDANATKAGKAAKAVADTVRGVEFAGATVAGHSCYGIIVRQINHEAATRPSNGEMAYVKGDLLGLLTDGAIMVKLKSAVKRDALVGMEADGTWSTAAAFSNVKALQAGAAGDVVPVRIFIVAANPVVTKAVK